MIHDNYVTLFSEIARTTEILAERVREYNKKKNDVEGESTSLKMYNDFNELHERIHTKNFNPDTLTRSDYAKLLVGTYVIANNLKDRIASEQKALRGYQTDIVPKLQRIMDETKTDEEAVTLANDLFSINEEEKN